MSGGAAAGAGSPGRPWSHFVGFNTRRIPPEAGIMCTDAFTLRCYAGPRTFLCAVVGDKVKHHRFNVRWTAGSRLVVGFVDDGLPDDDIKLLESRAEELAPKASCTLTHPLGATWCTVEVEWSVTPPCSASFRILSTVETLSGFSPDAQLAVTLDEGARIKLDFVFTGSFSGTLGFHPGFRPKDVLFDAVKRKATCSEGPRTVLLWGLPPTQAYTFTLDIVGSMNVLGMVKPNRRLLTADIKSIKAPAAERFFCGASGGPSQYAAERYFTDISGRLTVTLDYMMCTLTLRREGGLPALTFRGFPPTHAFAVTMYASSSVVLGPASVVPLGGG